MFHLNKSTPDSIMIGVAGRGKDFGRGFYVTKLRKQAEFNVAIKNSDDHAKNFSFQLVNGEWRLGKVTNS